MKLPIFLYLFLTFFIINSAFTQEETFRYINNDLDFQTGYATFEDENGDFIIAAGDEITTTIYKLNNQGELLESNTLDFVDYETQVFSIEQDELGGAYRLIGATNNTEHDSLFINIITLADNLEVLSNSPFLMSPAGRIFTFRCETSYPDTTLCAGFLQNFSSFQLEPFVFKISENLTFDFAFYQTGEAFSSIVAVPEEDYYLAYGFGLFKIRPDLSVIEIQSPAPFALFPEGNTMRLNDSLMLYTGKEIDEEGRDVVIGTAKKDGEEINLARIGLSGDTIDHPAKFRSIDVKYQDKIYAAGHTDVVINLDPYLEFETRFFIAQLDNEMNINWEQYYGGDAYYIMHGVLATEDGGCLVYGRRHDFINNPGVIELYVMKVDENGDVISSNSIPLGREEFTIFPNPFHNELYLKSESIVELSKVKIYDIAGRIMLTATNFSSRLDTSTLPVGAFVLVVEDKTGKILFRKKIIKN